MRENSCVNIGKIITMAHDYHHALRVRKLEEMAAVPDFSVSSSAKVIYAD